MTRVWDWRTRRRLPLLGLCLMLAGCGAEAGGPTPGAFSATGEVIAFGGGAAGAANACFTCHGRSGEGDGAGTPRLAGLPEGYLVKQLQDYADGRRGHKAMHWIASRLSMEDRVKVAAYYADLPVPRPAPASGSTAGARLWTRGDPARDLPACATCHGVDGQGGGAANPPLAGQPAGYLADQLRRWRSGRRQNGPGGVMLGVSRTLSDEEIAAVSAHAASLQGPASAAAPETGSSPPERRPDPRSGASAPPPRE